MAKTTQQATDTVNGFLNFNKPVGITSMDALRQIKRITGQRRKVGHAGTMDPLARGVLPICFGQGTRLMEYMVGGTKRYQTQVKLGETTTTYDAEGEVVASQQVDHITLEMIESALHTFIGVVQQTPPMYSAVKVNGQRLYKLARAGIEIERAARSVEIYDIQIAEFSRPKLVLNVECGRGVYIRSLAHDLGQALGCGAYVTDLIRQYSGGFPIEESVTLEQLEEVSQEDPEAWKQFLHPIDWPLRDLKDITVNSHAERYLQQGQTVSIGKSRPEAGYLEQFRAYSDDGRFLGLVRCDPSTHSWKPVKVFHLDGPSQRSNSSVTG